MKRRGVEGFLETLGASDRTVDQEFEEMKQHLDQMFEDLNDLGFGMSEFLSKAREFYKLTVDVAEVVDRYYNGVYNRPWESKPSDAAVLAFHVLLHAHLICLALPMLHFSPGSCNRPLSANFVYDRRAQHLAAVRGDRTSQGALGLHQRCRASQHGMVLLAWTLLFHGWVTNLH